MPELGSEMPELGSEMPELGSEMPELGSEMPPSLRYCVSQFCPVILIDLRAVIAGQKVVGM